MSEQNTPPIDDDLIEGDEDTSEDEILDTVDEETTDDVAESSAPTDDMDIDAALAAVSQLTLLTQDEPESEVSDAEYEPVTDEETSPDPYTDVIESDFEQPHDLSMSRGQLASVIPALTLIIIGGWLTFILTTASTPPTLGLLVAVVMIAIGVMFLSQWLTSARWSRGNFFIGTSIGLIGAIQLYLSQVSTTALSNGWTLWIVAIGIALFGAGYIALPRLPRLSMMGFLIIISGGIGYMLTSGALDPAVLDLIRNLWFVGIAIIIFMIIAPLIRRR